MQQLLMSELQQQINQQDSPTLKQNIQFDPTSPVYTTNQQPTTLMQNETQQPNPIKFTSSPFNPNKNSSAGSVSRNPDQLHCLQFKCHGDAPVNIGADQGEWDEKQIKVLQKMTIDPKVNRCQINYSLFKLIEMDKQQDYFEQEFPDFFDQKALGLVSAKDCLTMILEHLDSKCKLGMKSTDAYVDSTFRGSNAKKDVIIPNDQLLEYCASFIKFLILEFQKVIPTVDPQLLEMQNEQDINDTNQLENQLQHEIDNNNNDQEGQAQDGEGQPVNVIEQMEAGEDRFAYYKNKRQTLRSRLKVINEFVKQKVPKPAKSAYHFYCDSRRAVKDSDGQLKNLSKKDLAKAINKGWQDIKKTLKKDKNQQSEWELQAERDREREKKEWKKFNRNNAVLKQQKDEPPREYRLRIKDFIMKVKSDLKEIQNAATNTNEVDPEILLAIRNIQLVIEKKVNNPIVSEFATKLKGLNLGKVIFSLESQQRSIIEEQKNQKKDIQKIRDDINALKTENSDMKQQIQELKSQIK